MPRIKKEDTKRKLEAAKIEKQEHAEFLKAEKAKDKENKNKNNKKPFNGTLG